MGRRGRARPVRRRAHQGSRRKVGERAGGGGRYRERSCSVELRLRRDDRDAQGRQDVDLRLSVRKQRRTDVVLGVRARCTHQPPHDPCPAETSSSPDELQHISPVRVRLVRQARAGGRRVLWCGWVVQTQRRGESGFSIILVRVWCILGCMLHSYVRFEMAEGMRLCCSAAAMLLAGRRSYSCKASCNAMHPCLLFLPSSPSTPFLRRGCSEEQPQREHHAELLGIVRDNVWGGWCGAFCEATSPHIPNGTLLPRE